MSGEDRKLPIQACGVYSPDEVHIRRKRAIACVYTDEASVRHAHAVPTARALRPTFTLRLTALESTGGKRRRSAIMNSSREFFFAESSSSPSSSSWPSSPRDGTGGEISPVCVPLSFLSGEIKSRITERNKHTDIIIRIRDADKVAPLSFKVPRCLRG